MVLLHLKLTSVVPEYACFDVFSSAVRHWTERFKSLAVVQDMCCDAGVQVRRVNFGRLMKGILHSKFWIVDGKHVYIGSANMDWRALTQVRGDEQCWG